MQNETTGNVSLVLNYTELMFNYFVIERPWVVHTGAGLTYLVIIMNLFVIYLFLKTEQISPSTIVLAALAMSDGLSAMCAFLPKHFGYLLNSIFLIKNTNLLSFLPLVNQDIEFRISNFRY